MPFLIDDKKLIPAPLVTISRSVVNAADGRPVNANYQISLNGSLLPHKGSPDSTAWYTGPDYPPDEDFTTDDQKFAAIIAKQKKLVQAFSATGYKISYSAPSYPVVEFYPRLTNINFEPGIWVVKCDYTINLEANSITSDSYNDSVSFVSGFTNYGLNSISDEYSIREREENIGIFEISRNVNAVGTYNYNNVSGILREPWERAKAWVQNRISSVPFTSGLIGIASGINLGTHAGYNLIEEESYDRYGGRYSVSQRMIFHNQNYIETREISRSKEYNTLGNLGPNIERITINGRIQGLDPNNDASGKFVNANAYWTSISGGLGAYVNASGRPLGLQVNENRSEGSLNYSVNYLNQSDSTYTHVYDVTYTLTQSNPSVTIAGTIEGVTVDGFATTGSTFTKFNNAESAWTLLQPNLRNLAFAHSAVIASGSLYSIAPIQQTVGFNKANGTINYNYTFPYNPSGSNSTFTHEYSIEFNTENALPDNSSIARAGLISSATINGTVAGLASGIAPDPNTKVANAKLAWASIDDTLLSLVNNHYAIIGGTTPVLSSGALRKTVGLNASQGIITYSYTFGNSPATSDSRVAVQDVTVEDTNASDIFAVQIIPGRMSGPIIQNIGTSSERRRSINIALTLYPQTSAPHTWSYSDRSIPAGISSGIFSGIISDLGVRGTGWFLAGDSENWNPKAGLYSRNASVVY